MNLFNLIHVYMHMNVLVWYEQIKTVLMSLQS